MQNNTSGFYGYNLSDIYPGMGTGDTQQTDTKPDPEEQQQFTNIETPVQPTNDKQSKSNIWVIMGVILLMIVVFGIGKG